MFLRLGAKSIEKLGLNDMADISDEEFRAMYSVYRCGCDKRTEGSCVLNSSPVDDSVEPTTSVLESSRAPDSDSGHPGDYVMVQVIISSCYCEVNNGVAGCLSKVGSSLEHGCCLFYSSLPRFVSSYIQRDVSVVFSRLVPVRCMSNSFVSL
ncbi:hypothetical protein BUALT_Bualt06G0045300 [Buddleja alternifolia]|uniref:Uncharacterized protein n=1 Tax=Buddleja alternifolia TaxID=168488 RepID=A0AAV6XH90_9LAMI|nr:hypothetical protein BUALT_Bualt06G0045300 [Buddleja alternifolia]